ncbi:MAG: hypothetical protein V3V02_04465 [Rhizobiaceae bacterium]
MWLSNQSRFKSVSQVASAVFAIALLSGCTVEPLNATRPDSKIASGDETNTIRAILAATTVKPVETRQAQQVRNNLLFAMNGGQLQSGGQYDIALEIVAKNYNLSIETSSLAPTSAQVAIIADYRVIDKRTGNTVATGKRRAQSSYDRTAQSFANERAQRNAENQAAKEVAQQIKLSVAQYLADL